MLAPEAQHREVGEEQAAAGGDAQQAAQQIGGTTPGAASPPPQIERRLAVAGAIPASQQPAETGAARRPGVVDDGIGGKDDALPRVAQVAAIGSAPDGTPV